MFVLLYAVLLAVTTAWSALAVWAVWRVRHRRASTMPDAAALPGITVLKPLRGVDEDLEANLRTFFEQDYPRFQLVFGVKGNDDPAADVVRRLREEYPSVACRLVVHDGGRGLNPKVGNLRAMLGAVVHDVVVISDSNIAVHRGYLAEMAREIVQPGVGVVTHLFAGVGERTIGASLENLHLNATVAAGIAVPKEALGHPVVVGKSMMFRVSELERLGGFESIANVLAEDYIVGRMFDAAGYSVRICATPIANVARTITVRTFVDRHLRWGMIRLRLQPFAFVLEPLTIPLVVALLAPAFGVDAVLPLAWAIALTLVRDATSWWMLRGPRGLATALPLFPIRDVFVLVAWVATFFRRHITWRGTRVRVSAGTRLYAESTPNEPRMLRVEG